MNVDTKMMPGIYNLPARYFAVAQMYSDLPAVGVSGEEWMLSYGEMADLVRRYAAFIGQAQRGETIGLLSENRPQWGAVYMAVLTAGATVVPVDPLLKDKELHRVLEESGMTRLFVSEKFAHTVENLSDTLNRYVQIINFDGTEFPEAPGYEPVSADEPDRPAIMIFTSGTMGRSKRVILTHKNICSDIDGIKDRLHFDTNSRFLSVLPLHHTYEATCGLITPLLHGSSIFYCRDLNSRDILNGIRKHRITHFVAVPLLYEKILHGILRGVEKAPVSSRIIFKLLKAVTSAVYDISGKNVAPALFASFLKKAGFDSLELLVSGGAPVPQQIARGYSLLGFPFVEGYGLTETSPVLAVNPPGKVKFGSVGPPLDNVEVVIDDPDEKGVGEIKIRGPMTTPGYHDNPEDTAKLLRDGWLYTGDMGRLDDDGYLYISGRSKNLIVSHAGKNIYPEEIEGELLKSPYILEALVFGKKSASGREEVAALIYPDFESLAVFLHRDPASLSADDVKQLLDGEVKRAGEKLADYKRIKSVEYLSGEMEKTSSKKIKRYLYT